MKKSFILCTIIFVSFFLFSCDKKGDAITIEDILSDEDNFYMAVMANNIDTINLFVESDFDVNKKNKDGWTALSIAMRTYGVEDGTVDHLLKLGANPNIPDDDGETPLELAVLLRQNKKAISLLEYGALLQRSQGKKGTLVHQAICGCNKEVIEKMLEHGGEKLLYTKRDTSPDYPVELAIDISGDIDIDGEEVASMLLDHMDLSYTDEHGNTLLHRECIRGDLELVQMLLEKGMDINAKNNQGLTPLRLARNYNNGAKEEEIVTLLLSSGAKESEEKEEDCEPPFTEQDFIAELKQKSNLNERDEKQRTSLHYAISLEFVEAVSYLLSKSVDVNVQEVQRMTPLHLSIDVGNIEITKMLLNSKARLDINGFSGLTPLDLAIIQNKKMPNKYEIIELLISKGAPINGVGKSDPPIFYAVGTKDNKALEILIQKGADVNIFDCVGRTPLMKAIDIQNIDGFEILIMNGADIDKENKYKYSALDVLNRKEDSVRQSFFEILNKYSKK